MRPSKYLVLIVLFLLVVGSSQAQSGDTRNARINVMETRIAYSHDLDLLKHAYRMAFVEMELVNITETFDKIEGEAKTGNLKKMTAYFWNSDTLNVDVGVAAHYVFSPDSMPFYPLRLSGKAENYLESETETTYAYRMAIYPEGLSMCPRLPTPDSTANVKYPVLKGGLNKLAARIKYPEEAKKAGVQGRTFLWFTVDETGKPSCIETRIGFPYGINEAAIEAVRKAKFKPGTVDGKPTTMGMALPITFSL